VDALSPRVVTPGFHGRVYAVVREVPAGKVTTYGDVATALGSPQVARHVGWALAALREDDVPWHRVINAQGMLSFRGDTGRCALQRALLEQEGVVFDARGRVNLKTWRFSFQPRPDTGLGGDSLDPAVPSELIADGRKLTATWDEPGGSG
jgi:methylated-DNA-protein-cysteine methyltransferase related protein